MKKQNYIKLILVFLFMHFAGYLLAGDSIKLKVLNLSKNKRVQIIIPQRAITSRNGIAGVFVVEKGEARFRMIRLGKQVKTKTFILAGLFGNEIIILSNVATLYDGMELQNND